METVKEIHHIGRKRGHPGGFITAAGTILLNREAADLLDNGRIEHVFFVAVFKTKDGVAIRPMNLPENVIAVSRVVDRRRVSASRLHLDKGSRFEARWNDYDEQMEIVPDEGRTAPKVGQPHKW